MCLESWGGGGIRARQSIIIIPTLCFFSSSKEPVSEPASQPASLLIYSRWPGVCVRAPGRTSFFFFSFFPPQKAAGTSRGYPKFDLSFCRRDEGEWVGIDCRLLTVGERVVHCVRDDTSGLNGDNVNVKFRCVIDRLHLSRW